ncbi:hypothetical protein GPECTOR_5g420 [Gonium pectorale]|uniref:Uncharacterized protein n=1 Tax=Gonium pectorale TaxID=33097 RepID=A0A150GXC8_GONPE|nr:hypothetical protein GPECTOR_5g420 [Gonium pectorale]|eukprot:KXZ54338.1 hypothetical protein GPECTOR_5g420 [Gonium pectorale]
MLRGGNGLESIQHLTKDTIPATAPPTPKTDEGVISGATGSLAKTAPSDLPAAIGANVAPVPKPDPEGQALSAIAEAKVGLAAARAAVAAAVRMKASGDAAAVSGALLAAGHSAKEAHAAVLDAIEAAHKAADLLDQSGSDPEVAESAALLASVEMEREAAAEILTASQALTTSGEAKLEASGLASAAVSEHLAFEDDKGLAAVAAEIAVLLEGAKDDLLGSPTVWDAKQWANGVPAALETGVDRSQIESQMEAVAMNLAEEGNHQIAMEVGEAEGWLDAASQAMAALEDTALEAEALDAERIGVETLLESGGLYEAEYDVYPYPLYTEEDAYFASLDAPFDESDFLYKYEDEYEPESLLDWGNEHLSESKSEASAGQRDTGAELAAENADEGMLQDGAAADLQVVPFVDVEPDISYTYDAVLPEYPEYDELYIASLDAAVSAPLYDNGLGSLGAYDDESSFEFGYMMDWSDWRAVEGELEGDQGGVEEGWAQVEAAWEAADAQFVELVKGLGDAGASVSADGSAAAEDAAADVQEEARAAAVEGSSGSSSLGSAEELPNEGVLSEGSRVDSQAEMLAVMATEKFW